jgi:hypothetical protein
MWGRISIGALLVVIVLGVAAWLLKSWIEKPLFAPGSVRSGRDLISPLDPPASGTERRARGRRARSVSQRMRSSGFSSSPSHRPGVALRVTAKWRCGARAGAFPLAPM